MCCSRYLAHSVGEGDLYFVQNTLLLEHITTRNYIEGTLTFLSNKINIQNKHHHICKFHALSLMFIDDDC